jgi:hypothetical protein
MSRELFLPYDERRIQEIKDLINDRFWQANYEECQALRAAMDLLENIEVLTAEVDRLSLVADQSIRLGGLSITNNKGFKYILVGREKFEGDNWCGGDSHPELYEHISLMTEEKNELD